MKTVDAQRADRKVQRKIDRGGRRAFECHASAHGPAHAEIELELDTIRRKDRRQKRIRFAGFDRGATARQLRGETRRQVAVRGLDATGESDRVDIEKPATRE